MQRSSQSQPLKIQPFTRAKTQPMTIESFMGAHRRWVTDLEHGELTHSRQIPAPDNDFPC